MGLYINTTMVKSRLIGKIRFTDDPENYPDKMPLTLLHELIVQAESEVEYDMSKRYSAPFQTKEGTAFKNLPERPTKNMIRNMCILKAVMNCLQTEFGRGSATKGSTYFGDIEKQYNNLIEKQTELKDNSYNTFEFPPLPEMRLNFNNEEADTGFKGRVLTVNCDHNEDNYAAQQVNQPSRDFWHPDPKDYSDWTDGPDK